MANYREVKYCRRCKKRYLVDKGQGKKVFCEDCYKLVLKERAKAIAEDDSEE